MGELRDYIFLHLNHLGHTMKVLMLKNILKFIGVQNCSIEIWIPWTPQYVLIEFSAIKFTGFNTFIKC